MSCASTSALPGRSPISRRRDIKKSIDQAYAGNRFWPEPMIQLNPRFRGGGTVGELVRSGELAPGLERIFRSGATASTDDGSLTLHKHQLDAITLANQGQEFRCHDRHRLRQVVVLLHTHHRPGAARQGAGEPQRTRAIVIYPMNALANSQLEELDKRIKQTAFREPDHLQALYRPGRRRSQGEGQGGRSRYPAHQLHDAGAAADAAEPAGPAGHQELRGAGVPGPRRAPHLPRPARGRRGHARPPGAGAA